MNTVRRTSYLHHRVFLHELAIFHSIVSHYLLSVHNYRGAVDLSDGRGDTGRGGGEWMGKGKGRAGEKGRGRAGGKGRDGCETEVGGQG